MKYSIILLLLILFPTFCLAASNEVGNTYKKIDCGDGSYLEIHNDTFKSQAIVSCELSDQQFGFSPVYNVQIYESNQEVDFTRKEILLHIPLENLDESVNNYSNLSTYFLDNNIEQWVSFSTELKNEQLVGKVIHTGLIGVEDKSYNIQKLDLFYYIAIGILLFGLIIIIVYNKTMQKNILLIIFVVLFFGCNSNDSIDRYNANAKTHQEKTIEAFANLSASLKLYNEKKYDDSITQAQLCIENYTKVKTLSADGKEIAKNIKDQGWIEVFRDTCIQSEDIRIKQCELLKTTNTEAKKINPDTDLIASTVNQIADYNTQFNKLQITLNDIQNQHASFFK